MLEEKNIDLISELDNYRLKNKISQQKLAEILGVSVVTINHWLTRKAKVNKINEYQIKKLLNEVQQNDKEQ